MDFSKLPAKPIPVSFAQDPLLSLHQHAPHEQQFVPEPPQPRKPTSAAKDARKQDYARGLASAQKGDDHDQLMTEEHNFNYYHEYCRLFIANVVLTNQMKELLVEKNDLIVKLNKLEKKSEDLGQMEDDERKKRFRRTASMIERHYICPSEVCQKSYGSEGSLNQHIKIKHPELMSSLRESDRHISDTKSQYSATENESSLRK